MGTSLATFLLVMAVSPRGFWRVHGLHFDRSWRALQVGDELDHNAEIPTIDARTKAQIDADVKIGALAVKEASADEVKAYLEQIEATRGQDKDTIIAKQQQALADLEARLMKLELAPASSQDMHEALAKLQKQNLDLMDRVSELEDELDAASAPAPAPTPAPSEATTKAADPTKVDPAPLPKAPSGAAAKGDAKKG